MGMGIGTGIKFFRKQYSLDYADMESLTGIKPEVFEAIEKESLPPSAPQIESISTALGVSIPALIVQGIDPEGIQDPGKRRLLLELKPLFEAIAVELYVSRDGTTSDTENFPEAPSAFEPH